MCFDKKFKLTVKWLVGEQIKIEGSSFLHRERQLKHKLVQTALGDRLKINFSNL